MLTEFNKWDKYEHYIFNRIIEGIISVCLSNRCFPIIKVVKGSEICLMIAQQVYQFFENNSDFIKKECGKELNGYLFIYDRKEDPVTPLLNQWTYQAMIHELLGINNNIVDIKQEDNKKEKKVDRYVLNDAEDKFFCENLNNDFGDVASKIKILVENIGKERQNFDKQFDSIQDMKKLIENLPEKQKQSMEATKHTFIGFALNEIVETRQLLNLSPLEQDIACNTNKEFHFKQICSFLENPKINNLDKARLFMLFSLRYEGDSSIRELVRLMEEKNVPKEWLSFTDNLIQYAGKSKRKLDVFNNKDFIKMGANRLLQAFKDIPNVFTQHSSYMPTILEKIIKGKDNKQDIETLVFPGIKEKYNNYY